MIVLFSLSHKFELWKNQLFKTNLDEIHMDPMFYEKRDQTFGEIIKSICYSCKYQIAEPFLHMVLKVTYLAKAPTDVFLSHFDGIAGAFLLCPLYHNGSKLFEALKTNDIYVNWFFRLLTSQILQASFHKGWR